MGSLPIGFTVFWVGPQVSGIFTRRGSSEEMPSGKTNMFKNRYFHHSVTGSNVSLEEIS